MKTKIKINSKNNLILIPKKCWTASKSYSIPQIKFFRLTKISKTITKRSLLNSAPQSFISKTPK
jgi:hypothetical protein